MENQSKNPPPSRKTWTSEPMLWFIVIGAVLYGIFSIYHHLRQPRAEVTAEWLQTLSSDFERRNGHPLAKQEQVRLAHQQLEEEILYQEALRQGLAADPRVRGLLAAILREELEPALADPTDAELEQYRKEHPDAYQFPEQLAFEHVSSAIAEDIPANLLARLRAGETVTGDPSLRMANPLPLTWRPQLVAMFGEDFTMTLEKCKTGEWAGPFPSKRGSHFVKVTTRREPREMTFEEVKPALASQWLKEKQADAISARVKEWRSGYRVMLPEGIPAP